MHSLDLSFEIDLTLITSQVVDKYHKLFLFLTLLTNCCASFSLISHSSVGIFNLLSSAAAAQIGLSLSFSLSVVGALMPVLIKQK